MNKLKQFLIYFLCAGADGEALSSENRITIFTNLVALAGSFGAAGIYYQLVSLNIQGDFLKVHYFLIALALSVPFMNYFKQRLTAKVVLTLLLIFAGWNAAVWYGKSFNGYYLFFFAMVYSIVAFKRRERFLRFGCLALSIISLPFVDYLSHEGYLPVTGFHSDLFPVSLLISDSLLMSMFIVLTVFIEKSLSEKYERELAELNYQLEAKINERTQMLLKAKEEALMASNAKSQFIANTSHELRTPLGAIIGFVDLVLAGKASAKEEREYLETVRRNAGQLSMIIEEILDISKIEAQAMEINREVFSLYNLLDEVKDLMIIKAREKEIRFDIEIQGALPKYCYSDPLRLKQILINLIGNAIKFTDKGHILVTVARRSTETDCWFEFDIEDTGMGIPQKEWPHLFQPFSQVDDSLTRRHSGTGLGLALSKRFAELLEGSLELLRSTPGHGSTFRLKIRCEQAESHPKKQPVKNELPPDILKGKKILLVDDSRDNLNLISVFLTLAGAEVTKAENGQQALNLIDPSHLSWFDLILMDLQMPIMDGFETTKRLREMGVKTPIVAITAHAMKDEKVKTEAQGFTGYLTKPVNQDELLRTIIELT